MASKRIILRPSLRPPQGRLFASLHEKDLFPHLQPLARQLARQDTHPQGHVLILIPELVGPYGVADLVACYLDRQRLAARLALLVPPLLNEIDAALIAAASVRQQHAPGALARRLGYPERLVLRRLRLLLRSGALVQRSRGLSRPTALRPLGRLFAFEAKIDDWRRALRQASTYALWTDRSTVVLSRYLSNWKQVCESVRHAKLGLAVCSDFVRRPPPTRLPNTRRLWASEHVVAAIAGQDVTGWRSFAS